MPRRDGNACPGDQEAWRGHSQGTPRGSVGCKHPQAVCDGARAAGQSQGPQTQAEWFCFIPRARRTSGDFRTGQRELAEGRFLGRMESKASSTESTPPPSKVKFLAALSAAQAAAPGRELEAGGPPSAQTSLRTAHGQSLSDGGVTRQ